MDAHEFWCCYVGDKKEVFEVARYKLAPYEASEIVMFVWIFVSSRVVVGDPASPIYTT